MANEELLEPIDGADPCGADLQWDSEFMAADQLLDSIATRDVSGEGVIAGETVAASPTAQFDELEAKVKYLTARTRDLRVLAIRAETVWRRGGLPAFADALEDLVALAERWPDAATGCYPRGDPLDGDLGERAAAVAKLLNRMPQLVATVGWGAKVPAAAERQAVSDALRGVFGSWADRLEQALGSELPLADTAWQSMRELIGEAAAPAAPTSSDDPDAIPEPAEAPVDAWDLVERAVAVMAVQDRHSPALPILRLLLGWRAQDILEIAQAQRASGVTLEQLLDSIRNQLAPPA